MACSPFSFFSIYLAFDSGDCSVFCNFPLDSYLSWFSPSPSLLSLLVSLFLLLAKPHAVLLGSCFISLCSFLWYHLFRWIPYLLIPIFGAACSPIFLPTWGVPMQNALVFYHLACLRWTASAKSAPLAMYLLVCYWQYLVIPFLWFSYSLVLKSLQLYLNIVPLALIQAHHTTCRLL